MVIRRRRIPWPVFAVVLITGMALLAYFVLPLLSAMFAPNSRSWEILNSPLVTAIIGGSLGGVLTVARGLAPLCQTIPWPVCVTALGTYESRREIIPRKRFSELFEVEPKTGTAELSEDGWRFSGDGKRGQCSVRTKIGLADRGFTVAAQVKPVVRRQRSRYWRVGIIVTGGDTRADVVCLHLDNHGLVVAYLEGKKRLTVPCGDLVNLWTLLELSVSGTQGTDARLIHGRVNNRSYFLGSLPSSCSLESLCIKAWSDDQQYHVVEVRDVSLERSVA